MLLLPYVPRAPHQIRLVLQGFKPEHDPVTQAISGNSHTCMVEIQMCQGRDTDRRDDSNSLCKVHSMTQSVKKCEASTA